MKFILAFIFVFSTCVLYSQDTLKTVNRTTKTEQKPHYPRPENKAIGLSGITADTLAWSQFTNCDEITVSGMEKGEEVTMYRLSLFFPNKDLKEMVQWNSYLSGYTIRDIIAEGLTKIMISDVTI